MPNNRLFYAAYALGISPYQTTADYVTVRGMQSAGMSTRFNLESQFEIGQLEQYEQDENLPDVEVSLERVLDGTCPAYLLATSGATAATLVGRSNQRCSVAMSTYADTSSLASGTPLRQVTCSGMFASQVSYDFNVGGAARESLGLVGNNKVWSSSGFTYSGFVAAHGVTDLDPAAAEGINRRQDMVMTGCLWPLTIPGINASGRNVETSGKFAAHIQSVKPSANLGRENMLELGRRGPYFRYVNFPVEVRTEIEVMDQEGDLVSATEEGILSGGQNVADEAIYILMQEGLVVDLGAKNKLESISTGGGDARGGNRTLSFSYRNQNAFTVKHDADVTVALRP